MIGDLSRFPIHLGIGATAVAEPEFSGMEWYEAYSKRHASDGAEGRLVSMFTFDKPWDGWEVHPQGHEVVICTAGEITLIQEQDGKEVRTTLKPGEYAINPPGVWHTADVSGPATAVFITAGAGTQGRPRRACARATPRRRAKNTPSPPNGELRDIEREDRAGAGRRECEPRAAGLVP